MNLTKFTKFRTPNFAKTTVLELLDSSKLISRKIWMTEKSWNFQNVHNPLIFSVMVMEYFLQNSYQSLKNHCASFKQVIFTLILFFKLLWNLNDIEGYSIKELCHSVATVEKGLFWNHSVEISWFFYHYLREINFWDSKSAKVAILTHLQALNCYFLGIFAVIEGWNCPNERTS